MYNLDPKTREEHLMGKIAGNPNAEEITELKTREEHFLKDIEEAVGGGSGSGGTLPSVTWDTTVSTGFAAQETTATVNGTEFTKVSDKAFTHGQLDGAVFAMGDGTIPLDASMLSDMSAAGVTGTLITLPDPYGPVVFSCTEAGSVVTEPGFYLVSQMVVYAPQVTMSYKEILTAEARVIAVGTMEMADGITDLPSGVIYLQIEG